MSSIWLKKFYALFGFLFVVCVILAVTCSEIAIIATYFQLLNHVSSKINNIEGLQCLNLIHLNFSGGGLPSLIQLQVDCIYFYIPFFISSQN
jgi:hypothetical protein